MPPPDNLRKEIESLIRQTSAVEIEQFRDEKITLVGINLEQSSPLIGRTVDQVRIANPYIQHKLCVIYRNDESFIPHQNSVYKKDDFAYFLGKNEDKSLIAYLRLVEPKLNFIEPSLGRVSVEEKFRGNGLGRKLIKEGIRKSLIIYPNLGLRISAQLYLEKFYNQEGFRRVGNTYEEDGITHIKMVLENE